jgi:hypothetical protein
VKELAEGIWRLGEFPRSLINAEIGVLAERVGA